MPTRLRLFYSTMSLVLLVIAGLPIYQEFFRRSDIWWTPHAMLVPLAESGDRVEIYARGEPLGAVLQSGRLVIAENSGLGVLEASEVGLRFNNRDRVRAGRLPMLLVSAAVCGAIGVLFLLTLTGRLAYRGERGPAAA